MNTKDSKLMIEVFTRLHQASLSQGKLALAKKCLDITFDIRAVIASDNVSSPEFIEEKEKLAELYKLWKSNYIECDPCILVVQDTGNYYAFETDARVLSDRGFKGRASVVKKVFCVIMSEAEFKASQKQKAEWEFRVVAASNIPVLHHRINRLSDISLETYCYELEWRVTEDLFDRLRTEWKAWACLEDHEDDIPLDELFKEFADSEMGITWFVKWGEMVSSSAERQK